ncbi:flavoprotein WrbA [Syncephalis plumigaleata]|nr:flavoprotein WrbA [Syncephalis plumigaleata]
MSTAKVYVVYYSMYGHVAKLAHAMVKGARRVPNVDVKLYQNVPVIDPMELADADGILLGHPTRFGMVPAQIKATMDATGRLWVNNMLHGGQETTILSMLPYVAHLGMQFIPLGYAHPALNEGKEIVGGSPYGAGTVAAADGERPSPTELNVAESQGEHFAQQTLIHILGRQAFEQQQQHSRNRRIVQV